MIDCTALHYNKREFCIDEIVEHLNAFKEHLETVNAEYISNHLSVDIPHHWVTYLDPDKNWYSKSYVATLDNDAQDYCGISGKNRFYFVHGSKFYDMYLTDLLDSYKIELKDEDYTEDDLRKSQEFLSECKKKILDDYWRKEHMRRLIWELEKYYSEEYQDKIEELANKILSSDEPMDFRSMDEHGYVIELLKGKSSYDNVCHQKAKICSVHGLFGGYAHYSNRRYPSVLNNTEIVRIPGELYTRGKGNITISEIGEGVFEFLDNAKIIRLPHCIEDVAWSFWHCKNLERIEVYSPSQYRFDKIRDVDGVLYNADLTELLAYPNMHGQTYEVPEGVKIIRSKAFKDCDNLEELILPETLEVIEINAFYRCNNLKRIIVNQPKGKLVYNGLYGSYGEVNPKWYWVEE